jgi:uncharacterized protein YcaQ
MKTTRSSGLPLIDNRTARLLFLERHGLAASPSRKQTKTDLLDLIERIGFVQVDSINTVERAHHMILFSRNQTYRRRHLNALLERDRALFENWTHDAAIIPTRFYPYWALRFEREAERLRARWRKWRRDGFEDMFEQVLAQVRDRGPVMAREVGENETKGGGGWWDWHPSKTALEYLWRTGALAVHRREGFQKVYDLAERVIPNQHRAAESDHAAFVHWACDGALERLGFATSGELAAFWGGVSPAEAADWCARGLGRSLVEVALESADGSRPRSVFMRPERLDTLSDVPPPPNRIRALSPFDPLIRDRQRTGRLFGFDYRIEVFVPAPKRRYGYYVFPLLEGGRLIGRIDMKCRRQAGTLSVSGLWMEAGVKWGAGRRDRLEAELDRVRRFVDCDRVEFDDGWVKGRD